MEHMADKEIDPRFFLPPNVTGVTYKGQEQVSSDAPVQSGTDVTVTVDFASDDSVGEAPSGYEDEERLLPPDTVVVISQTARVVPGGNTVVDIVIDVEDSPRVSQYEVRVTK